LVIALAAATLALACEGADPGPMTMTEDPVQAIHELDQLTARLDSGAAVSNPEFQATMEPFAGSVLERWAEDQVQSASSSLNRLRSALLDRFRVVAPYCAEDGLTRYSMCGDGYVCVAAAQVIEVRCLWFASTSS
jgi:hypothetical protein